MRPDLLAQAYVDATTKSQRWHGRRVRYRPPGPTFEPKLATVEVIPDRVARDFVEAHHYSSSYPAARFRVGLYIKPPRGRSYLGGVAVYSVPMTQSVVPAVIPGLAAHQGVELGRLVLQDTPELVANAESWFVARAHRLLRAALPEVQGVVSYCDPVARRDSTGQMVKRSHTGVVYRAGGATLRGLSSPRTLWLMPDGTVANDRTLSKLRSDDIGREYAERFLHDQGAPRRGAGEAGVAWLARLKAGGFLSPLRHPGNLRFAWRWDGQPLEAVMTVDGGAR